MYYIIGFILILFAFAEGIISSTKSSLRYILILPVFFILLVIQGYNYWSPDMDHYQSHFDYIDNELIRKSIEPAHIFLIETVHTFGGSFSDFIFLYGIIIISLLVFNVLKYSPLPVFVLLCYFVVPFFPNIVQIRFFLGFNIFVLGTFFLDRKNIYFYILLIISILCHISLIVLIPFIFIRKMDFYENYRKANLIILLGALFLLIFPAAIVYPIVNFISPKFSRYLELVSISRYMGTIALFLPFFFLSTYCLWHFNNRFHLIKDKVSEATKKRLPIIIQLIQFSNFTIIPQYFARDFWRLSMNLAFFSLVYLSICMYYGWDGKYNPIKVVGSKFITFFYVIFVFYFLFLMLNGGEYMETIRKTIESNTFLESLI